MSINTKLIYFVRHGETKLNALGIRQSSEGGLTEKGRAQALATAKRFPKEKGSPQVIIASPYERTRETAGIIAGELKMPIEYCDLLVERRNPSEIIGHAGTEIEVKRIVDLIDKSFHDDNLRYSDEENFTDLKERAKKLLEYIKTRPEQRIMMITHGIFLKMVVSYMLVGDELTASKYNALSYLNPINNAGISICSYTYKDHWFRKREEAWKLIIWNDLIQNDDPKEGY
ncbi:MAG: histidine phosphatase family protein [Candidatus Pacebacteria bacterium]|nr:histidine phosphatase family protein [Candidatus Paceibacterota bacterium]